MKSLFAAKSLVSAHCFTYPNGMKPSDYLPFTSLSKPIRRRDEDLLGRKPFAEAIAARLKGWKGDESLTLALYGPWGSGKSSIAEMVVDALNESSSFPVPIRFNPWEWSKHDEISKALFSELRTTIKHINGTKKQKIDAEEVVKQLDLYLAKLNIVTGTSENLQKLSTPLITLFSLGAITAAFGLSEATLKRISGGVGVIVLLLQALTEFIKYRKEYVAKKAELGKKTLPEIKDELVKALKELGITFLVIIDDIDRLPPAEVRTLFQLVKANGNLPNVIYFLAFQRDVVEEALKHELEALSGSEYLKKIVQVGFDVPAIDRNRLEAFLREKLDASLERLGLKNEINRLDSLFENGFAGIFQNLRDVYAFLETADFHLGIFSNSKAMEVDPIDLLALESIRLLAPNVYYELPVYKLPLLRGEHYPVNETPELNKRGMLFVFLGEKAPKLIQKHVSSLLAQIFPDPHVKIMSNQNGRPRASVWESFENYFIFAVPKGIISQMEVETFIEKAHNYPELAKELVSYHENNQLISALDSINPVLSRIDFHKAGDFVSNLFECCDLHESRQVLSYTRTSNEIINKLIAQFLRGEPDRQKRCEILIFATRKTTCLYGPVKFCAAEHNGLKNREEFGVLANDDLKKFEAVCAEKIKARSKESSFINHPHLDKILEWWNLWANPNESGAFVTSLVSSRSGLLRFLNLYLRRADSPSENDGLIISIMTMEKLTNLSFLKAEVEIRFKEPRSQEEEEMMSLLTDGIEARKQYEKGAKQP